MRSKTVHGGGYTPFIFSLLGGHRFGDGPRDKGWGLADSKGIVGSGWGYGAGADEEQGYNCGLRWGYGWVKGAVGNGWKCGAGIDQEGGYTDIPPLAGGWRSGAGSGEGQGWGSGFGAGRGFVEGCGDTQE